MNEDVSLMNVHVCQSPDRFQKILCNQGLHIYLPSNYNQHFVFPFDTYIPKNEHTINEEHCIK